MSDQPLNGDQVEQVIRLSLPHFQAGVRTELDALRTDFRRELSAQTRVLDGKLVTQTERLEKEIHAVDEKVVTVDDKVVVMDDRLKALESAKAKVVMMWGIIAAVTSAVATLAWHLLTDWLLKKK